MPIMSNDILHRIALTMVPHIGDVHAKMLLSRFGDACSVFKASRRELEKLEGLGPVRAKAIRSFDGFQAAEDELAFTEKYQISILQFTDECYPKRLHSCYDAPILLYYKGEADLNAQRILSVVGTRNHTRYGHDICKTLMQELEGSGILIVSGLAYGIDTLAHRHALSHGLPTVAALGHGLDRIYPSQNKSLAKQMLQNGGLITDFPSGTKPDRKHFPRRNRITAGICDGLVVIETGQKGGSVITADIANSYNKDVFAYPGAVHAEKSSGCHQLIRQHKAQLVTSASDILESLNWLREKPVRETIQSSLFADLSADESGIIRFLSQKSPVHLEELLMGYPMSASNMAGMLLNLEIKGLIQSLPGKMYKLKS